MRNENLRTRPMCAALVSTAAVLALAGFLGCGHGTVVSTKQDAAADGPRLRVDAGSAADGPSDRDGQKPVDASPSDDGSSDRDGRVADDAGATGTIAPPATGTTYDFAPTDPLWIADQYSEGDTVNQFTDGTFFGTGARRVWTLAGLNANGNRDRIKYYPDVALGAGTYTWAAYIPRPGGTPGVDSDSVSFGNFLYNFSTADELDFECGWGDPDSNGWRSHVPGITGSQLVCGMSAQALSPVTQCWAAIETDRWNKFQMVLRPNGGTYWVTWKINDVEVCSERDSLVPSSVSFYAIISVENLTWMGMVVPPANDSYGYWDWFNFSP